MPVLDETTCSPFRIPHPALLNPAPRSPQSVMSAAAECAHRPRPGEPGTLELDRS
jgi:hypothetical protein